jgi:hypothetical protein
MYHNFSGYKQFRWIPIEKLIGKTLVNCDDKIVGYEEEQLQLGDGRTALKELKRELKPVRPDSVDEAILDFVCDHIKGNPN